MESIYLDNAATTPLDKEVIEVMSEALKSNFGNPSSSHQYGRRSRSMLESVRKKIAAHYKCSPLQVIFTSGGSEADNLVLINAVKRWNIKRVISSPIEHHAVLHTLDVLREEDGLQVDHLNLSPEGDVDLLQLEDLLQSSDVPCLVSLMLVNNEIGNILNAKKVSDLCRAYGALFHSDTVQGIGHVDFDLERIPIDFMAASAHKFHGPKGVGFAIVKRDLALTPLIHGGEQEMGTRAGTENTHSIAGMGKALDLAIGHFEQDKEYIGGLKQYFVEELKKKVPGVAFNGHSADPEKSAFHILSVRFPKEIPMLLFNLDLKGIAVSGGSACQSGSNKGSHVLSSILDDHEATKSSVRFSFSRMNNKKEIDQVLEVLTDLL